MPFSRTNHRRVREAGRPAARLARTTASAGPASGSTWPATPTRTATSNDSPPHDLALPRLGHHAFNRDLPYDRFTIEQLAGDLLPDATPEQKIATGFHRNTMINTEGGTDDEEFRVAAVVDRVNTTLQVWLGMTLGCAQCHNHKYDPITQREYYQLLRLLQQHAAARG